MKHCVLLIFSCCSMFFSVAVMTSVSFLLDTLSSAHLSVSSVTVLVQAPFPAPRLDQWTLSWYPLLPLLPPIRVCSPQPLGPSSPPVRPWLILQGPNTTSTVSPDLSWLSYQFSFIALNTVCIYVRSYEIRLMSFFFLRLWDFWGWPCVFSKCSSSSIWHIVGLQSLFAKWAIRLMAVSSFPQ